MSRRRKRGLQDEGEVKLTLNFNPDPKSPEKFRIVFPADDGGEESVFNVRLEPNDDPDLVNIYLENGSFVGTMTKPEPST